MAGEKIRKILDRKSIPQRIEDRVDERASRARNAPSRKLQREFAPYDNRNIGDGTMAGLVQAGVATILEDTIGVPFGASAEIVDTEPAEGEAGMIYTVDVNAPTANMAQARAFLESTTGFTSVLTDVIDVKEAEVLNMRALRDTYQVKVRIED